MSYNDVMEDKLNQEQQLGVDNLEFTQHGTVEEKLTKTVEGSKRVVSFIWRVAAVFGLLAIGYFVYLLITLRGHSASTYASNPIGYALLTMIFTYYQWIPVIIVISVAIVLLVDFLKKKKQEKKKREAQGPGAI